MAQSNRYIWWHRYKFLLRVWKIIFYFFQQKFLNFQFNAVHAEIEFLFETIMSFWPTVYLSIIHLSIVMHDRLGEGSLE